MSDIQIMGATILAGTALACLMMAWPELIGWFLTVGIGGLLVFAVVALTGALG